MDELLRLFEPLFKKWFDDEDMSSLMCYMIDIVDVSALPYLAIQFNVDGYRGWYLVTTEQAQRDLLKRAIEIQKHVGTGYAIKQALLALGYSDVTITEGTGYTYNGQYDYDGTINYGGGSIWVNFGVDINVDDPGAITTETRDLIRFLILEYKNARSFLQYLNLN